MGHHGSSTRLSHASVVTTRVARTPHSQPLSKMKFTRQASALGSAGIPYEQATTKVREMTQSTPVPSTTGEEDKLRTRRESPRSCTCSALDRRMPGRACKGRPADFVGFSDGACDGTGLRCRDRGCSMGTRLRSAIEESTAAAGSLFRCAAKNGCVGVRHAIEVRRDEPGLWEQ